MKRHPQDKPLWSVLATVNIDRPENREMRKIVADYIEQEMKRISQSGTFEAHGSDGIIRYHDDAAVSLSTQAGIHSERAALLRADGLAEHLSGLLQLPEQSPHYSSPR